MDIIAEKAKTVRKLGKVDISQFKKDVLNIPEAIWLGETKNRENDFSVFHHTQHVLFRIHTDWDDHLKYKTKPLWPIWEKRFMPLINEAVESYGYEEAEIPKAMLAKLLAGYSVDKHTDSAPRNGKCHKIHIPLITDPSIKFYVEDEPYYLEAGYAYEVNNVAYHHVVNDSKIDRVHFIFEYCEI